MEKETIIIKQELNGVCEIILNQPEKHNSLSAKMIEELTHTFEYLSGDDKTKVLIISSTGKSFCAGGDLDWMKKQIFSDRETRIKEAKKLADLLNSLSKEITIMHPGPINRGVEITSDVADSDQSIILNQVENGVAVRMAVLYLLASKIKH